LQVTAVINCLAYHIQATALVHSEVKHYMQLGRSKTCQGQTVHLISAQHSVSKQKYDKNSVSMRLEKNKLVCLSSYIYFQADVSVARQRNLNKHCLSQTL